MKHRRQNKFPELDDKGYSTRYYWFDGSPMSVGEWVTMTEARTQAVGSAIISGKGERYWVSTVLLGIDYSFGYDRAPKIFETALFDKRRGGLIAVTGRYATHRQAREGHRNMVRLIRRQLKASPPLIKNGRKP